MWKYIIFNSAWFYILLIAHFFKDRFLPLISLGAFGLMALTYLFHAGIDPFAWIYYCLFSALIFWTGKQFSVWVHFKSAVLEEEMDIISQRFESSLKSLREKSAVTEAIQQRANDIQYVYDKIKEMSQCLEAFETFLVFGEALSARIKFQDITLALFDLDDETTRIPKTIYRLGRQVFEETYDKNYTLKNRETYEMGATAYLCKLFEMLFESREPVSVLKTLDDSSGRRLSADTEFSPFAAYPIFLEKKIFGILIISGIGDEEHADLPILTERFIAEIERVRLYEKVETLAITDGLTGVFVRRYFLERLEDEIMRSRKHGFNLSFLMIDVDYFKRINDQYGHLVGDEVLRRTAEIIKKNSRELDLVGRYGGEEFGVLLAETDSTGALQAAERIRTAIAENNIQAYDENLRTTVSIGCATFPEARADLDLVLESADEALYDAKHQGRNRVCLAS